MSPNPMQDGAVVPVEEKEQQNKQFVCIFTDKTGASLNEDRFHINLNGNCTVQSLYQTVAEKSSYLESTFQLTFMEYGEYGTEIPIEPASSKVLSEVLEQSSAKYIFKILQKEGADPCTKKGGVTTEAIEVANYST